MSHIRPAGGLRGSTIGTGVTLETLFVDSITSTPTLSATTLLAGVTYLLIVEGTYTQVNHALDVGVPEADAMFPGSTIGRVSLQVGIDAESEFAYWSGAAGVIGHVTNFQISTNAGVTLNHLEPIGGPFATPQTGHLYRYNVIGAGHTAGFQMLDAPGQYADNYGRLKVTIQAPNGTGSGSGAGSLVPPTSSANNGDVLATLGGIPVWNPVDGGSP